MALEYLEPTGVVGFLVGVPCALQLREILNMHWWTLVSERIFPNMSENRGMPIVQVITRS